MDTPYAHYVSGHPRMGGEHPAMTDILAISAGSSPHGRGTSRTLSEIAMAVRVIPAWAGNIGRKRTRPAECTGHPRMGGEHRSPASPGPASRGSSPHGRGTFRCRRFSSRSPRVIPAWAGNMWCCPPGRGARPGHPRMGGEHAAGVGHTQPNRGSSPHGRGTSEERAGDVSQRRVIPAWAGNMSSSLRGQFAIAGHPRMGGEHMDGTWASPGSAGSSPHGRGT